MSVITPFLDPGMYLAEAIDSVMAQDYADLELLLVDDGSGQLSTQIAQEYSGAHRRIRYLEHPGHANRGTSATRNLGVNAARGEFIAFLDADDRWRPHKLREQLAIFDRYADVEVVCGATNYWSRWNGGADRIYRTGHVQNQKLAPPEALLSWYPLGAATAPSMSDIMLRRRTALRVGQFEERFTSVYEEHTFLAKLYLNAIIFVSSEVWSDYRQHDRSCSARLSRKGGYEAIRREFLHWFQAYLATTRFADDLRVRMALQRALDSSSRASFAGLLTRAARLLRKTGAP